MNSSSKVENDCYLSIAAPSQGLYKENGSKFLAFAYPVEQEDQAQEIIADLKREYFDARHHGVDTAVVKFGEAYVVSFKKFVAGVFKIVLIYRVIYYALYVAFVIAYFEFEFVYVHVNLKI